MKEKKYTVVKTIKGKFAGTFKTNSDVKGSWFDMVGKTYLFTKWEKRKNSGLFDTRKTVVIMNWTPRRKDALFDQNHISTFVMKLGLDPRYYDNPWAGVDSLGFSSNKYFDFTFFFIEKDNSIWMSIVLKNKEARRKFHQALKYLESL